MTSAAPGGRPVNGSSPPAATGLSLVFDPLSSYLFWNAAADPQFWVVSFYSLTPSYALLYQATVEGWRRGRGSGVAPIPGQKYRGTIYASTAGEPGPVAVKDATYGGGGALISLPEDPPDKGK